MFQGFANGGDDTLRGLGSHLSRITVWIDLDYLTGTPKKLINKQLVKFEHVFCFLPDIYCFFFPVFLFFDLTDCQSGNLSVFGTSRFSSWTSTF